MSVRQHGRLRSSSESPLWENTAANVSFLRRKKNPWSQPVICPKQYAWQRAKCCPSVCLHEQSCHGDRDIYTQYKDTSWWISNNDQVYWDHALSRNLTVQRVWGVLSIATSKHESCLQMFIFNTLIFNKGRTQMQPTGCYILYSGGDAIL